MKKDNNKEEQTHKAKNLRESKLSPMFSEEDVRETVKRFILAWLRGEITIKFPDAQELLLKSKRSKEKTDFKRAIEEELEYKSIFMDRISTCTENKEATFEEQRVAIYWLFTAIMSLRSAERIQGNFMEFNIEERLQKLEKRIKALNKVVQELIIVVNAIREGKKRS